MMRLTLRTLLAFMDDILDPQDAHEIGRKIDKSEYAQGLVRRVRDVLRRRQLAAPDLTGPGARLDPNTVAEYLDNTLPPERVPAVEKVCLDSDPHLAEAAACHQVLSLVLTEAAEVRPESRRRMYGLMPEPVTTQTIVSAGMSPEQTSPREAVSRPEVLTRAAGRAWVVPAVVAASVVLLMVVAWGVMGFPTGSTELAQVPSGSGGPRVVAAPAPTAELKPAQEQEPAGEPSLSELPGEGQETETQPAEGAQPAAPDEGEPESPAATAESSEPPQPPDLAEPTEPTAPESAEPTEATPPEPSESAPAVQDEQAEAPQPTEVGQYVGATQVLLLYDRQREEWDRLASRSKIFSADRLVALPGYRTPIALVGSGAALEVVGTGENGFYGTELEVLAGAGDAAFGVRLASGRVVVNSPKGETRLNLQFGRPDEGAAAAQWQLRLLQAGTRVGIEYRLIPPVGYRPEQAATSQATLYVQSGAAELLQGDQLQSFGASATHVIMQSGENLPDTPVQLADVAWITEPQQTGLRRRAARLLGEQIAVERPEGEQKSVTLSLIEQAHSDRQEVQQLAVQCLVVLGRIDVLAEVLDTAQGEEGEAARREAIDGMRYWIARGPDAAAQLRDELVRQRGEQEGGLRFRLLWGYSQAAGQDEAAIEEVLNLLSHDDLGVRELAAYHLRALAGGTTHGYSAHDTVAGRERDLQKVRGLHEKGKLIRRRREL